MNRIPGYDIPKESRMFCLMTSPVAIAAVMTWWRAHRDSGASRPPTLVLDLAALRDGIFIEIREPAPPPRRYHPRAKEPA